MPKSTSDFSKITELPGNRITKEQLLMIAFRYYTAGKYASSADILEIGCGPALGFSYLSRKGANKLVGIDINPSSIEAAKKYYGDSFEFNVADAHSLDYADETFDLVLMFEVVFYLSDPELVFAEIKRLLKPSGRFIMCQPNPDAPTFIPSPFSSKYYDVPELGAALKEYFGNVEIFGSFELPGEEKSRRMLLRSISKLINIFPYSSEIKDYIKTLFFGKNLVLKDTVDAEIASEVEILRLDVSEKDRKSQIIYSIAEK